MKASIENLLDDQLQGLLMPPKEAGVNLPLWLGLALLLCLLLLGLWRWNKTRNSATAIAQRKLQALMQSPANSSKASQSIAVELASLLCQGLGVNRLDQFQAENTQAWNTFQDKLNKACYSTQAVSDMQALLQALFNEAGHWLKRYKS